MNGIEMGDNEQRYEYDVHYTGLFRTGGHNTEDHAERVGEVIHERARRGWRFVGVFGEFTLIFERELDTDS